MVQIKNFTFHEMIDTQTGINNVPKSPYVVANLLKLMSKLQEIRDEFGYPIIVNSAYRSPEVNKMVKGAPYSNHLCGCAADITCVMSEFDALAEIIQDRFEVKEFTECIIYPSFIHIAISSVDEIEMYLFES